MRIRFPSRRKLRRLARRTAAVRYRHVVVPLLGVEETEHALDLACRLAADRGAWVVLVAPLVVPQELPLDAHFDVAELKEQLDQAAAIADSYGVGVRRQIVRTRAGALGLELAEIVDEHKAELLVIGAPNEARRGFHRPFPPEILSILREVPCRVMISTTRNRVPPWHGDGASKASSASSARTPSSPRRTATSARRSITPSASRRSSPSG